MTNEEKIKDALTTRFPALKDSTVIQRDRRVNVDVPLEQLTGTLEYLIKEMRFTVLPAITGLDEGQTLAVIYHLSNDGCLVLSLKTHLNRENPSIPTVTHYFPSADIYERELVDLLGIRVTGLKEGHRYPLHDTWPKNEFPLRKDWKGTFAPGNKESTHA